MRGWRTGEVDEWSSQLARRQPVTQWSLPHAQPRSATTKRNFWTASSGTVWVLFWSAWPQSHCQIPLKEQAGDERHTSTLIIAVLTVIYPGLNLNFFYYKFSYVSLTSNICALVLSIPYEIPHQKEKIHHSAHTSTTTNGTVFCWHLLFWKLQQILPSGGQMLLTLCSSTEII